MPKTKIAVTVDTSLVQQLDDLIAREQFPIRSQAGEAALAEKLDRLRRTRVTRASEEEVQRVIEGLNEIIG